MTRGALRDALGPPVCWACVLYAAGLAGPLRVCLRPCDLASTVLLLPSQPPGYQFFCYFVCITISVLRSEHCALVPCRHIMPCARACVASVRVLSWHGCVANRNDVRIRCPMQ